jgi:hypothetical protein
MTRSIRGAHVALAAATVLALAGVAPEAGAQQRGLRIGVAAPPPPAPPAGQGVGLPGYYTQQQQPPRDPRWQSQGWNENQRGHQHQRRSGTTVVYVPVPADYGYGYPPAVYPSNGYYAPGYYAPRSYTGVTDANGRPLTESLEPAPSESYGYTPDRSGSPYTVTDESMMVVEFQSGERRAFPACAWQEQAHDPQGRPRTIFYQPQDYMLVLRPGQRGRVLGTPAAGVQACYAIDQGGRVVLRY